MDASGTLKASGSGSILTVANGRVDSAARGLVQIVSFHSDTELLLLCEGFSYPLVGQPILESTPGTFLLPKDAVTHYVLILNSQDVENVRHVLRTACDLRQRASVAVGGSASSERVPDVAVDADPTGKAAFWGLPSMVSSLPSSWISPETGTNVAGVIAAGGRLGHSALVTSAEYAGMGITWWVILGLRRFVISTDIISTFIRQGCRGC